MSATICEGGCTQPLCPSCDPDATRCPEDGSWRCGDCGPCRCIACLADAIEEQREQAARDEWVTR